MLALNSFVSSLVLRRPNSSARSPVASDRGVPQETLKRTTANKSIESDVMSTGVASLLSVGRLQPQTVRMLRLTTRDIERHYFEKFRRDFALPEGDVLYHDKPDVRIKGRRTIGVEIARLYLLDGADPTSEQVQRGRREQVLREAQHIHRRGGGRSIELHVDFNPARPITKIEHAAAIVANIAFEIEDESQTVVWNPPTEADLLRYVHHNGIEYVNAQWRNVQSFSVPFLDVDRLAAVVEEKNAKAAGYEACDDYWLLLVIDFMDLAQDQEMVLPAGFTLPPSTFSKVLVYKPQFRHVLEVPQ